MKRAILVVVFFLAIGLVPAQAEWYGLDAAVPTVPTLLVESASADELTLHLLLHGFDVSEPEAGFVRLALPDEGVSGRVGEPAIPVVTRLIRLPFGAETELSVAVEGRF